MARRFQHVLLIGCTGAAGKPIAQSLADACGDFDRVAVLTSDASTPSKKALLDPWKAKGVEIIVGDLADDAFVTALFEEFEVIVSALGRSALQLQNRLVDIIASLPRLSTGHPRRFYPSEYGTDIRYDPVTSPHERPHQLKLKTRAHIEELAKAGKIEFTYIVTGPFLDTFFVARAGGTAGYDASKQAFGVVGSKDESQQAYISGTTYADTGKFVLSSLKTPEASANATLRVSSMNAKPNDFIQPFKNITDGKVHFTYTSLDEFRNMEKAAWDASRPDATVFTLTRIWYEGGSDFNRKPLAVYLRDGQEVEDAELAKQLFTDVPKQDLETIIRSVL